MSRTSLGCDTTVGAHKYFLRSELLVVLYLIQDYHSNVQGTTRTNLRTKMPLAIFLCIWYCEELLNSRHGFGQSAHIAFLCVYNDFPHVRMYSACVEQHP